VTGAENTAGRGCIINYSPKRRDHLGYLGVDSRIILKWSYGVLRVKSGFD
jgi:hypothetical protein